MKKIVCIALAACFVVALVSFSSSADVVNDVQSFSFSNIYLEYSLAYSSNGFAVYYTNLQNGTFLFEHNLPYSTPVPLFRSLTFVAQPNYTIPSYSGRALSLSYNVNFTVSDTDYLYDIPSDVDISDSAIFTGARLLIYFTDGTASWFEYDTFLLMDDLTGEVIDPRSDAYWESVKGSPANLSIYALFDVTSVASKTIYQTYLYFPFNDAGNIYYSNRNYISFLNFTDVSGNIDFAYSPFEDVVQDDLTDIKTQLGTIEQDVNRLEQSYFDLNQSINDFQNDLTSSDSSISSDISDKQDIIDSIQDAMQNDNALLDDNLNDMITGFPGAQDPFHNAPSPDGFFAVDFIQQLWSFIKAQTIFFDFIFLGLCFCLATFILRR